MQNVHLVRVIVFSSKNNQWLPDADINFRLEPQPDDGWILLRDDDAIERYDSQGRLMSIQLRDGLIQVLTYDNEGRLVQVTDPTGQSLVFQYESPTTNTQLASLILPEQTPQDITDNPNKHYHYENPSFPSALTGITDENGNRFATWEYDEQDRAVLSEHAQGSDKTTLIYNTSGSTQITDALNASRTYSFNAVLEVDKNTGNSQPAGTGCQAAMQQLGYDEKGNITHKIDFDGHRTDYSYDLARNLQLSRTEGLTESGTTTTATTTRTTQWHDIFRLPISITETGRTTTLHYDPYGHITETTLTDMESGITRTRTTTNSYASDLPGFIIQSIEDGPRTDVNDQTQFDYYPPHANCEGGHLGCRGQLKQLTNALGQTTQFTRYNAHGQLEQMIAPNGEITNIQYDKRQRMTRIDQGGQITQNDYDFVGQLIQRTLSDETTLAYSYDEAHRLIGITNNLGNHIQYILDKKGNHLKEEITDPDGLLQHHLEIELTC